MVDIRFVASEGEPNPEDKEALSAGLLAHHASKGHPRKPDLYSIFLKDSENKILGGVGYSKISDFNENYPLDPSMKLRVNTEYNRSIDKISNYCIYFSYYADCNSHKG